MPTTVVRRSADPLAVQQLWTAISAIRLQKQIPNAERIIRHVRREHGEMVGQNAEDQLEKAVSDELIIEYQAPIQKGQTVGAEQNAYRVTDNEIVNILSSFCH